MGDKSLIEWTDATWTPIRARRRDTGKVGVHCERVSPACANCYAAAHNRRNLPVHGTGLDFTIPNRERVEIFVDQEMIQQPLRWRRGRRIFVCSQTDLFAEFVTDEMIDTVFAAMALAPQHTFQVLTKRPERMLRWMTNEGSQDDESIRDRLDEAAARNFEACHVNMNPPERWPLQNVWLGVTAENQEWADKRIPLLLQTPAAKRFVSFEPMLGPIVIDNRHMVGDEEYWNFLTGARGATVQHRSAAPSKTASLDWGICGGESGHGARPMHPDWARSLRDQCQAAGVPFFFKQWGAWQNGSDEDWQGKIVLNDGRRCGVPEELDQDTRNNWPHFRPTKMAFVGKHVAGRLLEGREWSEFPEVVNGQK